MGLETGCNEVEGEALRYNGRYPLLNVGIETRVVLIGAARALGSCLNVSAK